MLFRSFAAIIGIAGFAAVEDYGLSYSFIRFGWLVLTVWTAMMAAISFGRERRTGALELLLVSPMSSKQIISGRVLSLALNIIPSAALLAYIDYAFGSTPREGKLPQIFGALGEIVVITAACHYLSLRFKNSITAFIVGFLVGGAAPTVLALLVEKTMAFAYYHGMWSVEEFVDGTRRAALFATSFLAIVQLGCAIGFYALLHRALERRKFAYQQ